MHTNFFAAAATIFSRVSAPPPAFDHRQVFGDLVRAVDVDRKLVDAVEVEEPDAVALQPFRGPVRARYRTRDPAFDLGQLVDEEIGGGSRAHTDHRILDHVLDRLARD